MDLFLHATQNKTLNLATMVGVIAIHVLALTAFFTFTWAGLVTFLVMVVITGGFGITLGYHRLLTHQSFKTPRFIRYLLTLCGCLALQNGPVRWVATHRLHHKHADTPRDPHSSKEGFWWAHLVWTFYNQPELASVDTCKRFAPDIYNDPILRWMDKSVIVLYLALAVVLFAVGTYVAGWFVGVSLVTWGCLLRTVYVWHSTWLVNSATHYWGYKVASSPDDSRNNWWVAWVAFGEGWHHNHHVYPRSARFGQAWFEVDIAYGAICMLKKLGLAYDVVTAPPALAAD